MYDNMCDLFGFVLRITIFQLFVGASSLKAKQTMTYQIIDFKIGIMINSMINLNKIIFFF